LDLKKVILSKFYKQCFAERMMLHLTILKLTAMVELVSAGTGNSLLITGYFRILL